MPLSLASLPNLAMNANSHTLGLPWVGGDAAGKKTASPRIEVSRDTDTGKASRMGDSKNLKGGLKDAGN